MCKFQPKTLGKLVCLVRWQGTILYRGQVLCLVGESHQSADVTRSQDVVGSERTSAAQVILQISVEFCKIL